VLVGEEAPDLEVAHLRLEPAEQHRRLVGGRAVLGLVREVEQGADVVAGGRQRVPVPNDPLEPPLLLQDVLGVLVVVPERGDGGLPFEIVDPGALRLDVKGAP
jgi:hypothetical protein